MAEQPRPRVEIAPDQTTVRLERDLTRRLPNGTEELVIPARVPVSVAEAERRGVQVVRAAETPLTSPPPPAPAPPIDPDPIIPDPEGDAEPELEATTADAAPTPRGRRARRPEAEE